MRCLGRLAGFSLNGDLGLLGRGGRRCLDNLLQGRLVVNGRGSRGLPRRGYMGVVQVEQLSVCVPNLFGLVGRAHDIHGVDGAGRGAGWRQYRRRTAVAGH